MEQVLLFVLTILMGVALSACGGGPLPTDDLRQLGDAASHLHIEGDRQSEAARKMMNR